MSDYMLPSFKTANCTYRYDIGSIQTLKGISWIGEGVVKVRYRVANTEAELSQATFYDTDIERFPIGSPLSSKFSITKSDIGLSQSNALVITGAVNGLGQNFDYLADAYGAEIIAVDVAGESFSLSALLQLDTLPLNSKGGRVYFGIRNDTNEILVQKRVEQLSLPVTDGYQEVFTGAQVEVDGYQYDVRIAPAEVRSIEASETKILSQSQLIIVDEAVVRDENNNFVTAYPVSGLVDAYGEAYGVSYNLTAGNGEVLLTKDIVTNKVNLLGGQIKTLNYEPITNSWIAADVDHKWTTDIVLGRGRYYYNFLVTTRRASGIEEVVKIQDPKNSQIYTDDFGESFSVIDVTDALATVTFSLCISADKVSVIGSFNEFVPDVNQLEIGSDLNQVKRMLLDDGFYTNGWNDWNRIDIYLNEPVLIERIKFETGVAEEERQKVLILLDDKPVTESEYSYVSGRDLSSFATLPIPQKSALTTLSEFDIGFDDKIDGYGYLDATGKVLPIALQAVLAENEDGYGLSNEEKYKTWRRQSTPSFSTDENALNSIDSVTECFNISSSISQVTLREEPEANVKIVRLDSFTTDVEFEVVGFDMSNRVIEVSSALARGMYRIDYYAIIYGGILVNDTLGQPTILQDARGNRFKYITGSPVTGATVAITDVITIESDSRNNFQLSHFPSSYAEISITTLGMYSRELSVGMTVSLSTVTLNSYLPAGTYVLFYTKVGIEKAEVFIMNDVFSTLTTIDIDPSSLSLFKVENKTEELYVTKIDGRAVYFNAPNQAGLFEVRYDVRKLTSTTGDAIWISVEDGYGEWAFIDGYGEMGADAYGSTRQTVQKVSLLTRLESHSGNPRKHKNFEIYTRDVLTQTITDFSLQINKSFEPYLTVHSLSTPQSTTAAFPMSREYVTVANADGTWELPVELYHQQNKITVISNYFDENGSNVSSASIVRPAELFEQQNPSIVEVTLPEPYIDPFKEIIPTYETQLTVSYGIEQYFLANIDTIIAAEDGYGELSVLRKSDDIWWLQREGVVDYIIDRQVLSISAVDESRLAMGLLNITYTEPSRTAVIPYYGTTIIPNEHAVFGVGQLVELNVQNISELVRLKDLSETKVSFFYNENYALPNVLIATLNDRIAVTLLPSNEEDGYGNILADGYGVMVMYSADLSEVVSVLALDDREVLQRVKFSFNATSEQMVLGQMSLKVKSQNINSACEIIVNGDLRYRSADLVNSRNLDPYRLVMHNSQFAIEQGSNVVYAGEFGTVGSAPQAILGASPREFNQDISAKIGIYELRRYLIVPQNISTAIGRYVDLEVTLDDYDVESNYQSLTPVIEYEQPVFPVRPKMVDI